MDDLALLHAFASGASQDACAEIVRRHAGRVYSTALRRTRDPHLAEDITQAVFLVLAKKAKKLKSGTVLAGWLYQCARLVSCDAIKANQRRKFHESAAATMTQTTDERNDATWNEISPKLESALDGLARKDRDAILLRYFKEI